MFYPTRRAIFIAALGVPVSLIAAILIPASWQIGTLWLAATLVLFFTDSVLAGDSSRAAITVETPRALAIGSRAKVAASVHLPVRSPRFVEFLLDADATLQIDPVRQKQMVFDRRASAEFSLLPKRRGEGHIERLWLRWAGPLGLAWKQRTEELARVVPVLPNIPAIKEEATRLFQRGAEGGSHVNLDIRHGSEYHALRDYQPGMNRRTIDWKQSARHRQLLAKEFQAEDNLHIVFALDTGRLMCEPLAGLPRLDRALQAALLMAYVGLKLGDRVGLFAFDEKPVMNSGTVGGIAAFPSLQELAAHLSYSTAETNFTLGLSQLGAALEHRSIVVVFTEFSDTTSAELMLENLSRLLARHAVLFVEFRDEELETMVRQEPKTAADISRAVIADAVLQDREKVVNRLRRLGAHVVDAPVEQIGMRLLEVYLKLKRQERQ